MTENEILAQLDADGPPNQVWQPNHCARISVFFNGLTDGFNAEQFKAMSTLDRFPSGLEIAR